MADQPRTEIIECYPIGKGLDAFRASVSSVCEDKGISCTPDALGQLGEEDIQNLAIVLLSALLQLPATGILRSQTTYGTPRNDLLKLNSAISSDVFDFNRINPLLKVAIANESSDNDIWN
ncbi:serine/threonine-protein kinase Sgk2 [Beauveria brongniartii RCEF 3172]|uniref:Serine/threonine-protein kinase Sgk2 n=1 Tax=Beauveria brongniartii RCEF 3172 TaxID=1081107 RepID=A0A166Z3J2_9HYPO|nr:serine/threonine-protein kinase Sgk2 [Beauveria brongniartii RCEF 3172]